MLRRVATVLLSALAAAALGPAACAQSQPQKDRKVLTRVVPGYPDLARRMYLRGTVRIEAVVAPDGTVKSTHVIGGNPVLTRAANDAIEKWKWAPAPQESKELVELNFHPE